MRTPRRNPLTNIGVSRETESPSRAAPMGFSAATVSCLVVVIKSATIAIAGADPTPISVQALDPFPTPQTEPIVHHLFGGQAVELPLVVRGHALSNRPRLEGRHPVATPSGPTLSRRQAVGSGGPGR